MKKKFISFEEIENKSYQETWDYQKIMFNNLIKRKSSKNYFIKKSKLAGYLLFVEYPYHIYTIGKNGKQNKNLLVTSEFLDKINATIYSIDRGGDITYHGPGQLIVYPIFDMHYFFLDLHKYLRYLEEVVIHFLWKNYKIHGIREQGNTGVWIPVKHKYSKKICSIGIKINHWITMHGFALNINTNLKYFNYIIPCGLNRKMTSLKEILNDKYTIIDMNDIKYMVKNSFKKIFNIRFI